MQNKKKMEGTLGFPRPLKAAIFDLDGTLMNTLDDIARIANSVLLDLSYQKIDPDKYRYFLGNGAKALLESIHKEANIKKEDMDRYDQEYMRRYGSSKIGQEAIYPGILDLLKELKKRGLKLAVLTNKPDHIAQPLLERIFPGIFDMVMGQQEGIERKPSPQGFEIIAGQLGFTNKEAIYLGDTNTDMQTGKSFGAFTVGVLWGFRDRKELVESGADLIISQPEDLLSLIDFSIQ